MPRNSCDKINFTKNFESYKIRSSSPISPKFKNQTIKIIKNYLLRNWNIAELEAKIFKRPWIFIFLQKII